MKIASSCQWTSGLVVVRYWCMWSITWRYFIMHNHHSVLLYHEGLTATTLQARSPICEFGRFLDLQKYLMRYCLETIIIDFVSDYERSTFSGHYLIISFHVFHDPPMTVFAFILSYSLNHTYIKHIHRIIRVSIIHYSK